MKTADAARPSGLIASEIGNEFLKRRPARRGVKLSDEATKLEKEDVR